MNRSAHILLLALCCGAASAAPGDSAKEPLRPPSDWGAQPSSKAVQAVLIEGEATSANGWGVGIEATVLHCKSAMELGMVTALPVIAPGADQPNPSRKLNYVSMAGDRFVGRTDYQNYRPDGLDDASASSSEAMCHSHYGYQRAHTTVVRHIDGDRVSTWEAPSDGRPTLTRLRSRSVGIVPLLDPSAIAPGDALVAGGATRAGFQQVAGWRCERFTMPDHSDMCFLVAQPGLPAMLVGYKMLQTAPPGQPAAAQITLRVNRLQPGIWVDAGVFTPPPAAYAEARQPGGGRAPAPAPAAMSGGLGDLPALLKQMQSANPAASAPAGGRR